MKKLYILFAVGASVMMSACSDFLDREPMTTPNSETFLSNASAVNNYINGLYIALPSFGTYDMGVRGEEKNSDNIVAEVYDKRLNGELLETGGGTAEWQNGYQNLRNVNYFFEYYKVPEAEETKDVLSLKGEAYFFRAYWHFYLLTRFGSIPVMDKFWDGNATVAGLQIPPRDRSAVAQFIIDDLKTAKNLLYSRSQYKGLRICKEAAIIMAMRVALYEGTWEKYHKGTGRVPGDATWPGKRIHTDFSTNMDNEINFFLDEAMKAAEQVADDITLTNNTGLTNPKNIPGIVGWNPYFEMFAEEDMSSYSEVLFWKQYMNGGGVSITHGTPAYIFTGGNNGMLKSFVDCFVMKDGLPYYAAGDEYKGDKTIMDVKENRDLRLQMFVLGEKDLLPSSSTEEPALKEFKQPNIISLEAQTSDNTGYRIRKCLTYNNKQIISGQSQSTTGCIIFRGVEAYLNYLEAYYLRNNKVDGKAKSYWDAVRNRAGITGNFQTTIDNTDMNKETDLAAHPGSYEVDATLYNIRRERRCEFIGEGMRWDDLVRWRAWDGVLTNKFIPEGYNFWEEAYKTYELPEDVTLKDDPDDATSNISSRAFKYIRPFSKVRINNQVYDGYSWAKANYLSPVAINEMRLASPDNSTDNSVIYQNPYWPEKVGGTALE